MNQLASGASLPPLLDGQHESPSKTLRDPAIEDQLRAPSGTLRVGQGPSLTVDRLVRLRTSNSSRPPEKRDDFPSLNFKRLGDPKVRDAAADLGWLVTSALAAKPARLVVDRRTTIWGARVRSYDGLPCQTSGVTILRAAT